MLNLAFAAVLLAFGVFIFIESVREAANAKTWLGALGLCFAGLGAMLSLTVIGIYLGAAGNV